MDRARIFLRLRRSRRIRFFFPTGSHLDKAVEIGDEGCEVLSALIYAGELILVPMYCCWEILRCKPKPSLALLEAATTTAMPLLMMTTPRLPPLLLPPTREPSLRCPC